MNINHIPFLKGSKSFYSKSAGKLMILLAGWILIACEPTYTIAPFYEGIYKGRSESISEFIENKPDTFSTFWDALVVGELDQTLTAFNPHGNGYTLFLPTNEAFDRFIKNNGRYSSVEELLKDKEYVKELVRYHSINSSIRVNDFPFGSLPDTCLTGDLVSVNYRQAGNDLIPYINNVATIQQKDIMLTNGFIHVIDEVLEPIVYNNYEWLKKSNEFSIFVKALEITGLKDTFAIEGSNGKLVNPPSSVLVEPDIVFNKNNIKSIEDLIARVSPDNNNYTSPSNNLYQFVAYHILEGIHFLNSMEGTATNYSTFTDLPVFVDGSGLDIKINTGVTVFDTVFANQDTTLIDYIGVVYDLSNVITKNGAIHVISEIMDPYEPPLKTYLFQFYEEPLILKASSQPKTVLFTKKDQFEVLQWEGVKNLSYTKAGGNSGYYGDDYIELNGDFTLTYKTPKIRPGIYNFLLHANANSSNNAFIKVYLDGKRVGGTIDLTVGTVRPLNVSSVAITSFENHVITIQTLIPGRLLLDALRFDPVSGL